MHVPGQGARGHCLLHLGCLQPVEPALPGWGAWQLLQQAAHPGLRPDPSLPSVCNTDSVVLPALYAAAYAAYTAACGLYEWRSLAAERAVAQRPQEQPGGQPQARLGAKTRSAEWDLIKAIMLFFVILLHIGRQGFLQASLSHSQQVFFLILSPFAMPCFTFISGVWGASVESAALAKMLCYTLGTLVLAKLMLAVVLLCTPGPKGPAHMLQEGDWVLWYLKCLAVWRLTLTPLFHVARQRGLPPAMPFVVVCAASYALRHSAWPPPTGWLRDCTFFAPFYAQGLLLPATRWSGLLRDRRFQAAAVAFLLVWCGGLAGSARFRAWNDVACALGRRQCPSSHWPASVSWGRSSLGLEVLRADLCVYVLMDGLMLAVMWLVAAMEPLLQSLAPRLLAVLAGCGARTLYGYVLHEVFLLVLGMRMGVRFPPMPDVLWILICVLAALLATFVWCCRLTERLFAWALMPFWLLDWTAAVAATTCGGSTRSPLPPAPGMAAAK